MVKIEAIIKPFKLREVKKALGDIGAEGMMVFEGKGFGHQEGHTQTYRGAQYKMDYTSKLMLTLVVENELGDATIKAIQQAADTGNVGDGEIFITRVEEVMRIRMGVIGAEASGWRATA